VRAVLKVFLFLSLVATASSLVVHVAAFFGRTFPYAVLLHVGIFLVFIPAMLVARPPGRALMSRVSFNDAFRGAPTWVRKTVKVFFAYAIVNFIVFIINAPGKPPPGPMTPQDVRGFSGHWMLFYTASAAMFLAALNRARDADRMPGT